MTSGAGSWAGAVFGRGVGRRVSFFVGGWGLVVVCVLVGKVSGSGPEVWVGGEVRS